MRESTVIDLFGNRTTLRFDKMVENRGTKPAEFDVEVPEGTVIIDLR